MTARSTQPARVLDVELLALDLSTCTRCTGTLANIERAIETLRPVVEATGAEIRLRKAVVASEEEARRHRFVSSPTIRVDGRDIVFETRESACGSCSDLCGFSEATDCRVWSYQGAEHEEAPVGLVVEALLRELVGTPERLAAPVPEAGSYAVPENLRRFFAGKAAKAAPAPAATAGCCAVEELATCCAPEAKSSCCGTAQVEVPSAAPAACGCA